MLNSNDLIERLKNNDPAVIEEIIKLKYADLTFYAYRIIHNESEAEDIARSKIYLLWDNRHRYSFDTIDNLNAFLYISVTRACFNYNKQKKRRNAYINNLQDDTNIENNSVSDKLAMKDVDKLIEALVQQLEPQCARVMKVVLKDPDMKPREIAKILGMTSHQVRTQKSQGLKELRKMLSKRGLRYSIAVLIIILAIICKLCF